MSVLWTHWAFAGAAFTFPLQHWITRSVGGRARRAPYDGPRRGSRWSWSRAALVLGVLAWLVRDDLFHRDDAWFPVMIALVTRRLRR